MSTHTDKQINYSEDDMMNFLNDTSRLLGKFNANRLSSAAVAAQESNALSNSVEFWNWMGRNYSNSGIFDSSLSMQQYISQGATKEAWLVKQLQGKGYEWDWMSSQRADIHNLFNIYDAGDVANRAASDVTQTNILTGNSSEYQMKAYISSNSPHLDSTPKTMNVVTNTEKTQAVTSKGFSSVNEFQDAQTIQRRTQDRLDQAKSGTACASYNFQNIAPTIAKAGLIGCVIGMGAEALASYKAWKQGTLSNEAYLKEILKSGGDCGVTSGITAGIMIPVTAAITTAGASTLLTFPVAFVVSGLVNKVVAPCFGRGEYKKILSSAKYYQNIELIYNDLIQSMQYASSKYYSFVSEITIQNATHQAIKKQSVDANIDLLNLYNSI